MTFILKLGFNAYSLLVRSVIVMETRVTGENLQPSKTYFVTLESAQVRLEA